MTNQSIALLEGDSLAKGFGPVRALADATVRVHAGMVTCLLGDNGAGKSTLIKILAGVEVPDRGSIRIEGEEVQFHSPREALDRGVATVFQDLAVVPIMPVFRNFFLGREPTRGRAVLKRFDVKTAREVTLRELEAMGIRLADANRPIGTLSGGERQCVAIARAIYFGAKVLILDEPTSALGVREAEIVLRFVLEAKKRGVGILFITHNAHHAFAVGDSFAMLQRGRTVDTIAKEDLSFDILLKHMAGGQDLDLSHEI